MKRVYVFTSLIIHVPLVMVLSRVLSNGRISIHKVGLLNRRVVTPFPLSENRDMSNQQESRDPIILGGEKEIKEVEYVDKDSPKSKSESKEVRASDIMLDSPTNNSVSWIKKEPLSYPSILESEGVEGEVVLLADISKDGAVLNSFVTKRVHPLLDEYTQRWLYSCKIRVLDEFSAQTKGQVTIRVFFRLKKEKS